MFCFLWNRYFNWEILNPDRYFVYCSIEETGQAVQFEQKFSYRRPMYDVIKYIWTLEEFRDRFSQMAVKAEREIESEVTQFISSAR